MHTNRIYNDYLMGSKIDLYKKVLLHLISQGSEFDLIKNFNLNQKNPKIFLRHDIDSDLDIAYAMSLIEAELGIKSTYYFRISTMKEQIIKEIADNGNEIGYHYEEIASFAKNHKLKNKRMIMEKMTEIRELFCKNFLEIEKKLNLKIETISSHGDFINRYLGITNKELINKDILNKLGILFEAYDIEKFMDFRYADRMYPVCWYPSDLSAANLNGYQKGLVLVHPRQWGSNPKERFKLDYIRLKEEIKWRI